MNWDLDSHELGFDCPSCGHKLKETIGRLKHNPTIECASCHQRIDIKADSLREAVETVDRSLRELSRTIEGMGKRR